ncbi:MAG TPA: enoyl-CoA hydratase/isomerase family protein [Jatrophihabitantaceae bacterium]|nr:enoyl-CoA hydratase/isomerase family protein [Jatrophihabitantaceae bacterium]
MTETSTVEPDSPATRQQTPEKVTYERSGPIAYLRLNRPDKLNAIDYDCLDLLERHIATAAEDDSVAAVIISGNGRCFCAGADLQVVAAAIEAGRGEFDAFLRRWHEVFAAIESSAKPTIAAIHGVAMAGGFELAQVCDFVVISDNAVLADQHANFGLFPGGGSTQRLPRLIARRQATWMLYTGEPIAPSDALACGLVNRVVSAQRVLPVAAEMAHKLAQRSPRATAAIKAAVRRGAALELADALVLERSIAVEHMTSRDAAIGLAAFRTRTRPDFGAPPEPGAQS